MNALTFPILRYLADGQFHSGEAIARHFGVTRATVWNALKDAEALGVSLFSVRGKGYRLPEPVRFIDTGRVAEALGPLGEGFMLELHDRLDSTNSYLLRRAAEGAPHGLCVAAEWQTAGRGRRGRKWLSGLGGSLTFSVLWRFEGGAGALSGLSLAVGVALMRALRELGAADAGLKWPNDVLHDHRKLAGILVELQGDMDGPSAAVIGIGLNLRLPKPLRDGIDQPVTDLQTILGQAPDPSLGLGVVLRHLAGVLVDFARQGFAGLREEWAGMHAYHGRRVHMLMPDGRCVSGTVAGIAPDGALQLFTETGLQRFAVGEVGLREAPCS